MMKNYEMKVEILGINNYKEKCTEFKKLQKEGKNCRNCKFLIKERYIEKCSKEEEYKIKNNLI